MTPSILRGAAACAALLPVLAQAEPAPRLQPFQMVRSLQHVQDRIAAGDQAALPMQRKLLELVDSSFREAGKEDFDERRNFRALLVFGMSGGNPGTIELVLSRLQLDNADRRLGDGVLSYLRGEPQRAEQALSSADPMKAPPELGAFLALVKGSLMAGTQPKPALKLLDQARLLGPGTLVEEAALRRAVSLNAGIGNAEGFIWTSVEYVRRFLRSPYASQFADAFVAGVVALDGKLPLARIADATSLMDPEQAKVIYLRIARRAAIDGLSDLSAFASAAAVKGVDSVQQQDDPRADLYSSLTRVTSENVGEVAAKLATIDRTRLTESDRLLLDAAATIAGEVTGATPAGVADAAPAKPAVPQAPLALGPPAAPVATAAAQAERPASPAAPAAETAAAPTPPPARPAPVAAADRTPQIPDRTELLLIETRKKLEAIDKLLEETAR